MTMTKPISSTFSTELAAAGLLSLPFAWTSAGDITFGPAMTSAQIAAVEAVYAAHDPTRGDPAQQAAALLAQKLAEGLALTSTGAPALNGTYALDATSTAQIFQIGLYASQFATFPSGSASQPYPDTSGAPHVFSVAEFIAFLKAVAPLVSGLTTQAGIMAQGGVPNWPSQSATIA